VAERSLAEWVSGATSSSIERTMKRIGLIGFGFIGAQVYERVCSTPALGLEIAFVHNRSPDRLAGVAPGLILEDVSRFAERRADLVVEMAHPRYTRDHGEAFLAQADYLPLSVTALADDDLRSRLVAQAARSGHRLYIPHGALIGTDNLLEGRDAWESVTITFVKGPASIDFSESGIDPATITSETVVYDGPVRGIASLFPRNVNTMVTCALATVGLDRCRARLVAVPGQAVGIADIQAVGRDGSRLVMRKEQPMAGVSGTEMFESQFASILRAAGGGGSPVFV